MKLKRAGFGQMSINQVENVWLCSQPVHLKTHTGEKLYNVDSKTHRGEKLNYVNLKTHMVDKS